MEDLVSRLISKRAVMEVPFLGPPGKGVWLLGCDSCSWEPSRWSRGGHLPGKSTGGVIGWQLPFRTERACDAGVLLQNQRRLHRERTESICFRSHQIAQLRGTKAPQQQIAESNSRVWTRTHKSLPKIKMGQRTCRAEGPSRSLWKVHKATR